jgi:hypothetical protein
MADKNVQSPAAAPSPSASEVVSSAASTLRSKLPQKVSFSGRTVTYSQYACAALVTLFGVIALFQGVRGLNRAHMLGQATKVPNTLIVAGGMLALAPATLYACRRWGPAAT